MNFRKIKTCLCFELNLKSKYRYLFCIKIFVFCVSYWDVWISTVSQFAHAVVSSSVITFRMRWFLDHTCICIFNCICICLCLCICICICICVLCFVLRRLDQYSFTVCAHCGQFVCDYFSYAVVFGSYFSHSITFSLVNERLNWTKTDKKLERKNGPTKTYHIFYPQLLDWIGQTTKIILIIIALLIDRQCEISNLV